MITLAAFMEPRGIIKVIQFIFVICAFACTCDFRGAAVVELYCNVTAPTTTPNSTILTTTTTTTTPTTSTSTTTTSTTTTPITITVKSLPTSEDEEGGRDDVIDATTTNGTEQPTEIFTAAFKYPFNLEEVSEIGYNCSGEKVMMTLSGNYSSTASFYVFVGVVGMLFVVMMIGVYIFLDSQYKLTDWMPLSDMIMHIIFTVMWFAGAISWATALTSIKRHTGIDEIVAENPFICNPAMEAYCTVSEGIFWQLLDFSVVFGFLNVILFGGNIWFLYKETKFANSLPHPTIS